MDKNVTTDTFLFFCLTDMAKFQSDTRRLCRPSFIPGEEPRNRGGLLTLFNEEISEGQHDRVAAVQVIPTHVMRAGDGQTSSGEHLHHPPHLGLPVSMQL